MIIKILFYSLIILVLLLIIYLSQWRKIKKVLRFRENLKPQDNCRFKYENKWVKGWVIAVWKERNLVRVHYKNAAHKLSIDDVFPC